MKKRIKLTALLLSAAMITGCADNGYAGTDETQSTTSETETSTKSILDEYLSAALTALETMEGIKETSSAENEATDEEEEEIDEALFEYYDLLDEEYEKNKQYIMHPLKGMYDIMYVDGKLILQKPAEFDPDKICDFHDADLYTIIVYDVKDKKIINQFDIIGTDNYYYNGYIYNIAVTYDDYMDFDDDGKMNLFKYDLNGNLINTLDTELDPSHEHIIDYIMVSNEPKFLKISNGSFTWTEYRYYMCSENLQTKTELPVLQKEIEHGFKEDIEKYSFLACYKNKLYVVPDSGDKVIYCLNTDTLTWSKVEAEMNDTSIESCLSDNVTRFGKYLLLGRAVYDMENDEIIALTASNSFASSYSGVRSYFGFEKLNNLEHDLNGFYNVKYTSDSSAVVSEYICDIFAYELLVDDEYYVYKDDYGYFLRTYEKREEDEEIIYLFNS